MIDTKTIIHTVDLTLLIETNLREPGQTKGHWTFWHCPFHAGDQTPSLGVNREDRRWFCFGCRKGGDAITWLREYLGMTFNEACEALGADQAAYSQHDNKIIIADTKAVSTRRPDELQTTWKEIVRRCQQTLWEPVGGRARDYLHQRGLKDSTLQSPFFRLGYSPGFHLNGVRVERGIILPCFTTANLEIDYISYIKIRRPQGDPKYKKLAGGGARLSGLFGAEWARGADVVFVAEGEFDALLLHQEAGDLVGVCTLGGAGDRLDFARFGKYLLAARHIIIAYDRDSAGQKGAEAWQDLSKRVLTTEVPAGKDITEYYLSGGNLADWVMDTLQANLIE